MLTAEAFGSALKRSGFDFFVGVPCSSLRGLINYSIDHLNYIGATNEAEGVAIAAGAEMAGRRTSVVLQNSGLANALAPLTSLNAIYKIPVLGFVSLRGEPGTADEPQHTLIGQITESLLKLCRIVTFDLSADPGRAEEQIQIAEAELKNNSPVFFIVRNRVFEDRALEGGAERPRQPSTLRRSSAVPELPSRAAALAILSKLKDAATALLTTTGKCSRELFEIEDSRQHFYMVGSMGCISSIGLGVALAKPGLKVIAVDGDGSLLMRMGSLATNGYYRPPNMLHILLDNHAHDSTGGQNTVSSNVDFAGVAANAGYRHSVGVGNLKELAGEVELWKKNQGLTFLSVRVAKGSKPDLARPTIPPENVKIRFMEYLRTI